MKSRNLLLAACPTCLLAANAVNTGNLTLSTAVYAIKGNDTLYVDIIQPKDSVTANCVKRPAVIFLSGGGWENQARRTALSDTYPLLPYFAGKGFVGVAADYRCDFARARKSGNIPDKSIGEFVAEHRLADEGVTDAIDKSIKTAIDDLFDATSYIIANSQRYNIDTERIVVIGSSAGAITALTAEHALCNNTEKTRSLPPGFNYAAVVSMAGGVWCAANGDSLQWKQAPCPLLMFHGDTDPIVPYATLKVPQKQWNINGVKDIANQMQRINVPHILHTYRGMNHDAAVVPMNTKLDYIYNFLRQTMLQPQNNTTLSPTSTQ